ncbi:MAG: precorrin-6Y C5,15-methyltransferase (decarboxylating) subunit CbiT [Synergistaceae bacterium]|jgi:precorrin-6Y C5,15-methyltransferase (decarboxylating) CbiT subunit|nr:precorrin-6Y C5,15-methyltransferase (decarboxylating) subunit CbiT [Synergistaceae bacterium]
MREDNRLIFRRGVVADEWFERNDTVPMTKAPVRSMVVSLLSPLEGASVLEIGSGTGAMCVDLARAVGSEGHVASIEVSPLALDITRKNLNRADLAERVELIAGKAPGHIPKELFQAVFIGGHGEALEVIIGECLDRLDNGGRIVVTAITPRTTSRTLSCMEGLGIDVGFWRVHSSAGRRTASDWLLQGNNPIDVIWGDK